MIDSKLKKQICTVCNKKTNQYISLPNYPITEVYLDDTQSMNLDEKEFFINQQYNFCEDCNHAFLEKVLDIRYIYNNYWTTSSVSAGAVQCLSNFSSFIKNNINNIDNYKNFIDIGGNDSTFFNYFKKNKNIKINIDPNASGPKEIIKIKKFFDDIDLKEFKNFKKIICSSHTIEHLENPNDLISKISESMSDEDECFLQFPSIEMQAQHLRYDQISHQHLNLFSLQSISKIASRFSLSIIKYEYDLSLYGTLRIYCKKTKNININSKLNNKIDFIKSYKNFSDYYENLNAVLCNLNEKFNGFGAGLMVPTLAYNLEFIKNNIDFIYEDNTDKINKKYPGIKAKILNTENLYKEHNIIITSISTKISNRNIIKKLNEIGISNIINPVLLN